MRVESLPIRSASGLPIPMGEIDDTVERTVRTAVRRGARVLLHVVDGSKTGLRAPSLGLVRRLQDEIGDALTVVVDAAQMRTRTQTLVDCVAAGWMVMISGSKFFGGPPFSGALLVPPHLTEAAAGATRVPAGFGAYLSACDVPQPWRAFRASLPATPNLGLMVRWRAALAEMQSFHALSCAARDARLGECRRQVQAELERCARLEIVPAPVGDRDEHPARWDGAQTIFTFVLKRRAPALKGGAAAGERSVLNYDEAWQVYVWLNSDVSAALPAWATAAERQVAAQSCHIGQPVKLKWRDGGVAGALRIALGARSVRAGVSDAICVLDKIDIIMRYWQQLTARPAAA